MKFHAQREDSPLVSLRAVFETGSASDASGIAGAAHLTAALTAGGGAGTKDYFEILELLFPTASHIQASVDKQMTAFSFETHADNLDLVYSVFRDMLLQPGWREEDFERVRTDAVNGLTVGLRGHNDEELAKEVLSAEIYQGHPYGTPSLGLESGLLRAGVSDLKSFAGAGYTRDRLSIAVAGGYPDGFEKRVEEDFSALPAAGASLPQIVAPAEPASNRAVLVEKPSRSVAMSLGYPLSVVRGHEDFAALLVAASCFGQHRMSSGRLFHRMRQLRGLNYGDYAYIEHFPGGMFSLEPEPNLARHSQIFEIWIRPVDREQAHFGLRLALHELDKLVEKGLSEDEFHRTRKFLQKYPRLLLGNKLAELGYHIDSGFYSIPRYDVYLERELKDLTLARVNDAIRRHLRPDRFVLAAAGEGMEEFAQRLSDESPSPISYNSPKHPITAEDRIVEKRPIGIDRSAIRVVPVEEVFA